MVTLVLAKTEDFDFYYDLKNEQDDIYWCGYRKEPNYEHLKQVFYKWLKDMVEPDKRKVYIISFNDSRAGYIYITPKDNNEVEISIGVSGRFSGHGIGTNALIEAARIMKEEGKRALNAYVREDNQRSLHVFKKSGFIEDEGGAVFNYLENRGEEVKMLKLTYDLV